VATKRESPSKTLNTSTVSPGGEVTVVVETPLDVVGAAVGATVAGPQDAARRIKGVKNRRGGIAGVTVLEEGLGTWY
jgi:hypothetical protein